MTFSDQPCLPRRSFVIGTLGMGTAALFGAALSACGGGDSDPEAFGLVVEGG
ncbi:MAG: hypothetical protein JSS01_17960 [Proteobacteria bacterium]|nr:hypothetical protein [Pseudomonadota bacterium]